MQDFPKQDFSRRGFLRLAAASSAALAMPIFSEGQLAAARMPKAVNTKSTAPVFIDANENPLGPTKVARQAIVEMAPQGGRYDQDLTEKLEKVFCERHDLPPDRVRAFSGSSAALQYAVLAYTSPSRSYVTADPSYEAGMRAAVVSQARVVKVPLTPEYAHDVPAMLRAAPDAGLFYVCNPNNPSGTMTPREQIEALVAQKPANSLVMVDEAYYHFTDMQSCLDLAKTRNDVIVLRTFSKIYGMAGLRCGFAVAQPQILERLYREQGWNPLSTPGVAAAIASLREQDEVRERRAINAAVRSNVFAWLDREKYPYIPSQTNFFLLDTQRNGNAVIAAMAAKGVHIGRTWPIWPSRVRITVGTQAEMDRFQQAYRQVMQSSEAAMLENIPADFRPADWRTGFVS
jgi:histidinol-phosphate aminotransferase